MDETTLDARPVSAGVAGLVALVGVGMVAAWTHGVVRPAEDAVVLFDYARNLATRGLVTYGGADLPIEGATDFLWMLLIAAFSALGLDAYTASLVLSTLSAAGLTGLVARRAPGAQGVTLSLAGLAVTPFLLAALLGFSPLAFSAAFVLVLDRWRAGDTRGLYLATLLLCLVRPDGVVWALWPCAEVFLRAVKRGDRRVLLHAALGLIAPGVAYFLARAWAFDAWLPLPFLVKSSGARELGLFFLSSVKPVGVVAGPALLAAAALAWAPGPLSRWRDVHLARVVAAAAAVPVAFYLAMRLEQNIGNRFLAPLFFGTLFLLAKRPPVAWAFVVLVAVASAPFTRLAVRGATQSADENVFGFARSLADLDAPERRLAVTEAGRLAYYSGWTTHDVWGLNTPAFARRLITAADLDAGGYDLVNAHCPHAGLVAATPAPADAPRSWGAMCATLTAWMAGAPYDVYLLPYLEPGADPAPCPRHDLYAVRRDSPVRAELLTRLTDHGAVPWSADLRSDDDGLCLSR